MLFYSGRNINNLGLAKSCTAPSQDFNLVLFQMGLDIFRFNFGICMPKDCDTNDLDSLGSMLLDTIKTQGESDESGNFQRIEPYLNIYLNTPEFYTEQFSWLNPLLLISIVLFLVPFLIVIFSFFFELFFCKTTEEAKLPNFGTLAHKFANIADENQGEIHDESNNTNNKLTGSFSIRSKKIFNQALEAELKLRGLLSCFSPSKNYSILKKKEPKDNLSLTFDLLRIICYFIIMAMNQVVTFVTSTQIFSDKSTVQAYVDGFLATWLQSSIFLPDLLFFVSSFCAVKSFIRILTRGNPNGNISKSALLYFYFIVKRYVRLAPLLFLGTVITWKLLPLISGGPLAATDFQCSSTQFWSGIFMMNSKFISPEGKMCSSWYWFVVLEFQYSLVAPLLVFLHEFNQKLGVIVAAALGVICLAGTFVTSHNNQVKVLNSQDASWFRFIISNFVTRGSNYFFGCAAGFIHIYYKRYNRFVKVEAVSDEMKDTLLNEKKEPRLIQNELWYQKNSKKIKILMIIGIFALIGSFALLNKVFQLGMDTSEYPQLAHDFYNVFAPLGFNLGYFCIVFSIVSMIPDLYLKLRKKDDYPIFRSFHYEIYILHMPVALFRSFSFEQLPYFATRLTIFNVLYTICLTLGLGLAFFFGFSLPLQILWYKYVELNVLARRSTVKQLKEAEEVHYEGNKMNELRTEEEVN